MTMNRIADIACTAFFIFVFAAIGISYSTAPDDTTNHQRSVLDTANRR